MNPPPDELREKLNALVTYLDELETWLQEPSEPIGPKGRARILERMFQLIVECAADAGDLWLQEKGHLTGESVQGVFERLGEKEVLANEDLVRFREYVSLRNRIIHDYERIASEFILDRAPRLLSDCRTLCQRLIELL